MKVYDMNNGKWCEKKDLMKESYEIFLKDLRLEDGFENEKDMQKCAMQIAREYIEENTLTTKAQVKKFQEENE